MATHRQPRIGVEADFGALADAHVRKVGFLEIGLDPRMRGVDQCHRWQPRDHHLADLQSVRLRDAPRARRAHRRPVEVHLRLRPLDARRLDLRIDPARRARGEFCARFGGGGFGLPDAFACLAERVARGIIGGFRREALFHQRRLPVEGHLGELHILARRGDVDARRVRARRQIADFDPGGVDRRGRLRDAQRIGLAVDAKEQLAFCDLLAVADGNFGDPSADFGGDRHLVHLDIGVVGRHRPAARQPPAGAARDQQRGQPEHQQPRAPARLGRGVGDGRGVRQRIGLRRALRRRRLFGFRAGGGELVHQIVSFSFWQMRRDRLARTRSTRSISCSTSAGLSPSVASAVSASAVARIPPSSSPARGVR